ncbi:spore coat protein CotJC [bacterium D16-50]|nr:spore coat protein CotJC [bacterium D16-50]
MWSYEKRLEFPVNIKEPNAKLAQVIISQFGGPDGELSASMRYLSQRYSMPYREVAGLLTDIGSEASEMFLSEANAFFDAVATV